MIGSTDKFSRFLLGSLALILVLAVLAVFSQVIHFDFINLDDNVYVTHNLYVQRGLTQENIFWAFGTLNAEFWHPLTWLSLMLDHQLYGLNAGGYHFTNLILHALSMLLLFLIFNRMTKSAWLSVFVAALFGLHPLRVESVAWIAERKDVLSTFFWMLTLYAYIYYTEKPVIRRYLLVLFSFAFGLMSKPMIVTLPVVMILLDYWPLDRFKSHKDNFIRWQIREKLPLFIMSAIVAFLTIYAQPKVSARGWPYPFILRIKNAFISLVLYLEKTFWPHDLSIGYPFYGHAPLWQAAGACIVIIIISILVIFLIKRMPYLFVGWGWFCITILPVIGIIPVGNNAMADRYTYIPSIGIAIMLLWGIAHLFQNENIRKRLLLPAGIVVVALLSFLTWRQCSYWENSFSLYRHAISISDNNYIAHHGLGYAFFEQGKLDEAIDEFNKDIKLRPYASRSYAYRGASYVLLGRYPQALDDFNQAILLRSDYVTYLNRGVLYYKQGQYTKALEDYNESIRIKPDQVEAYMNRAVVYAQLGRYQLSMDDFNHALSLKPDHISVLNNRAITQFNYGFPEPGCRDAQKACILGDCKILQAAKAKGICR